MDKGFNLRTSLNMSHHERGRDFLICFQVLPWLVLALCIHGAITDKLHKRSDDTNPLENALQQQALVIQQQAAELEALHSAVEQLTVRVDKAVSFTAYSSKDPVSPGSQGTFVFDVALSNIGNGYDTLSGIFTAPYSGTYLFLLNIMIPNHSNTGIQVVIVKSGTELALAHADSINDDWDKGMCHATAHLKAGDKVWVQYSDGLQQLAGGRWTSFSGALIHAD